MQARCVPRIVRCCLNYELKSAHGGELGKNRRNAVHGDVDLKEETSAEEQGAFIGGRGSGRMKEDRAQWIRRTHIFRRDEYEYSVCGYPADRPYKACPRCGAQMKRSGY